MMETIPVAIISAIVGFYFGRKLTMKNRLPGQSQALYIQAIDRANYLQTLRRELANILVWHNPQRYFRLYQKIHTEVFSLQSLSREDIRKRLDDHCKRYPDFSDFDSLAIREYVLYRDGISTMDDDELELRYRDLVMYAALSAVVDGPWKDAARTYIHTTSERELAHLTKYVQRIEDTKLLIRIEQAMDLHGLAREGNSPNFSNDHYAIIRLPDVAEIRYGVHLKRTNEFAIYSFFVFDDGRISQSFYRSDADFQKEQRLEPLHSVLEENKRGR